MLFDFSAFFFWFLRAHLRLPCVFSVLRNLTNPPNIICGLAIFCYFSYLFYHFCDTLLMQIVLYITTTPGI
jgi:hypothetical protein